MRFPIPQRARFNFVIPFAVALVAAQLLEHTNYEYSALSGLYVLIFALAFNMTGGLVYPSGYWVFFNGFIGTLFGIVFKAILGEPGHTNMHDPVGTLMVECAAMTSFGMVGAIARRIIPKKPLISLALEGESIKKAAIGCFIVGAFLTVTTWPTPNDEGTLASALRQVNHFNEMAVLLATFYQVRKSHGRSSTNWIIWAAGSVVTIHGILLFSKQGILGAPVTWFVAAVVTGFSFSKKQIVLIVFAFVIFQQYLVPYSQVARNYRSEEWDIHQNFQVAVDYLSNLADTKTTFENAERDSIESDQKDNHLYNQPEGFFDRLCMLKPDDDLVSFTNQGNVDGLLPTYYEVSNIIPHFLWKNKPDVKVGNMYAHEMGQLADEDDLTGISYSPEADAYHQATWFGVFLVLPPLVLILFYLMDSLAGDVRTAPWGVLYIVGVATTAPEGTMGGLIYTGTFFTETILAVALVSKYILPIFAGVITNTERTRVRKTQDFAPIPVGRGPRSLNEEAPYPEVP